MSLRAGRWAFVLALVGVVLSGVMSNQAFATIGEDDIKATVDKAALQGVYNCYKYDKDGKTFMKRDEFSLGGYNGDGLKFLQTGKTGGKEIPMPSGIGAGSLLNVNSYNLEGKNYIIKNCYQLFNGSASWLGTDANEGILKRMGKKTPAKNDMEAVKELVTNMGYEIVEKKNDCEWLKLSYTHTHANGVMNQNDLYTNAICKDSSGKLVVDEKNKHQAEFRVEDNEVCLFLTVSSGTLNKKACTSWDGNKNTFLGVVKSMCNTNGSEDIKCGISNSAGTEYHSFEFHELVAGGINGTGGSLTDYDAKWSGNVETAAETAIDFLSGGKYKNVGTATTGGPSILVGGLEKRLLYQTYLTDYYGVKVDCAENVSDTGYDGKFSWLSKEDMTMKICHYKKKGAKSGAVNGVSEKGWFESQSIENVDALIKEIEKMPKSYSDEEIQAAAEGVIGSGAETPVYTSSESDKCMSGAAGSLGWIVCPVLEWLGDASEGIYNEYVEPSLRVEPKLITGGDNSDGGVRAAWGTFQNIANIVFVILLLVVIFSQLTGVGIDNYGIKKILPKLIIAVVLINLSYLICELAVDLSNILGNSFQGLFNEMSKALEANSITIDSDTISTGEITGLTGVGLLGALVAGGAAIYLNPAILLSLLVAAVGVAVSIFFLFIILSAREAAVIALIVISPIAVVLYALPNTRRIFDKWWKMFEGMLLVYPICGLLVGAGGYVSKLLLASGMANGSFMGAFTSMIVSIVPIFFIPTVLRGSFSAMGNLGARISGIGQRASGALTGAARNSQAFKGSQERGMERRTRIQAGVDENGNAINVGRLGSFMRGGQRNMARARAQYLKNQDMRGREANLMGVGYDAAVIGQTKRAEADQLANYTTLINDRTRNGEDETALFNMFDQYMANGNKAGAVAVARIAGRRKDTAANFAKSKLTGTKKNRSGQDVPATTGYDQGLLQSVAKEMTTGENSGNYRASAPVAFEFASQINKAGYDATGNLQASMDYGRWANSGNVGAALEHHVTNSKELVGMKNSSLGEIADMMEQGKLDTRTVDRMRKLARETISNRGTTGVWDTTKEVNINRIAGNNPPFSAGRNGGGQQGGGQRNP